jgi:hypothetical protein
MSADPTPNRPTGPAPEDRKHTNPDATRRQPEASERDDYDRDDPDERAGLRRPRGGTPNVPRT